MKSINVKNCIFLLVVVGVCFQIFHFIEHLVQFGVWVGGKHDQPYMSPIAMHFSHHLGELIVPSCTCPPKPDGVIQICPNQMMIGMELLHLIGNGIFLATIAGIFYFMPTRWVKYAFMIELFHLYEHIMLTSSVLAIKQPIGLSTLFGGAEALGGHEFAVGYRVSWHFVMNLIPSTMIMIAYMRRKRKVS